MITSGQFLQSRSSYAMDPKIHEGFDEELDWELPALDTLFVLAKVRKECDKWLGRLVRRKVMLWIAAIVEAVESICGRQKLSWKSWLGVLLP